MDLLGSLFSKGPGRTALTGCGGSSQPRQDPEKEMSKPQCPEQRSHVARPMGRWGPYAEGRWS